MMLGVPNGGAAMFVVLALAGIGSAAVLGLALAALVRRQSRSYLLVALALSALLVRTGVAVASATGGLGEGLHHVLEHGLDAAMAALVIAAVYHARSARRAASDERSSRSAGGDDPRGERR